MNTEFLFGVILIQLTLIIAALIVGYNKLIRLRTKYDELYSMLRDINNKDIIHMKEINDCLIKHMHANSILETKLYRWAYSVQDILKVLDKNIQLIEASIPKKRAQKKPTTP